MKKKPSKEIKSRRVKRCGDGRKSRLRLLQRRRRCTAHKPGPMPRCRRRSRRRSRRLSRRLSRRCVGGHRGRRGAPLARRGGAAYGDRRRPCVTRNEKKRTKLFLVRLKGGRRKKISSSPIGFHCHEKGSRQKDSLFSSKRNFIHKLGRCHWFFFSSNAPLALFNVMTFTFQIYSNVNREKNGSQILPSHSQNLFAHLWFFLEEMPCFDRDRTHIFFKQFRIGIDAKQKGADHLQCEFGGPPWGVGGSTGSRSRRAKACGGEERGGGGTPRGPLALA